MRRSRVTVTAFAAAAGLSLAGCGITDPYAAKHESGAATTTSSTAPPTSTDADPPPERGGTIPASAVSAQGRVAQGAGQVTPQAALARFGRLDINWSVRTVVSAQQHLAAMSVGQARAQALQAAASYRRDSTLQASSVANSGQVVTVARSIRTPDQWVVVTSEQTTGTGDYAGLPPTIHVTYAQVTHVSSGWVVSQWAPQS